MIGVHLDTEQIFNLTGEHVDGCSGGKSADQRIRHEGRQSAKPEASKKQLSMIQVRLLTMQQKAHGGMIV